MTSKTLRKIMEEVAKPPPTKWETSTVKFDDLLQWMRETEARLEYLELMVESPKERP